MRFKWLVGRRGILLIMIGGVATVWLASTKQLSLYIHPRYTSFSVIASLLGLLAAAQALKTRDDEAQAVRALPALALLVVAFLMFLIVKPTVLSSNVANQRGLNASLSPSESARLPSSHTVQLFASSDFNSLALKEWAALLDQTSDVSFFAGKHATLTGFVTADQSDAANVFFVSRFVIRCCAVDAQPVGVPVYLPNWPSKFKPDQWVTVKGTFANNPSLKSERRIALKAGEATVIPQPKEPYVY